MKRRMVLIQAPVAALALVRPQPTTTPYVRVQGGGLDHPPLTRG